MPEPAAETIEMILYFEAETPREIRVADCMQPSVWLPKDKIEYHRDRPTPGHVTFTISKTLAREKGLI